MTPGYKNVFTKRTLAPGSDNAFAKVKENLKTMDEIERIKKLSDLFGPSGFEDDVAEFVKEEIKELNPVEDHMRNVTAVLNPSKDKPKVMLDCHMDEVGVIVQAVKPNGTMKFLTLGGMAANNLPSDAFVLKNKDGKLVKTVVANKPVHFMSAAERNQGVDLDSLVLDCGSSSKKETEESFRLGIASPGVPDVQCVYDEEHHIFHGKAFDNRVGTAAQIETLKRLAGEELPCEVQASFAVQEEVGERGVMANYNVLKPDVMIAFEGCPADDTFSEEYMIQAGLHKGPMLRHFDVSMITSPRFQRFALDLAEKYGIPVQESVRKGGGTNAGKVHLMGVPCIVIGVPVRYIHSSNCIMALEDYENAVKLAVELCRHLDKETVGSF
ncbi:MAG: M20/M25/M40 family metallo-hydrolase [Bulleidia sp.]|nr:M20/M25/M40 family metallo-hydrolase [Bulleidia sp.]